MKKTIDFLDFKEAFSAYDRAEQFSRDGLQALWDGLQEYEACTGYEIELDVVALCCEYTEASWEEIASYYSIDISDCEDDEEIRDTAVDYLSNHSWIAGFVDGGCVYQAF